MEPPFKQCKPLHSSSRVTNIYYDPFGASCDHEQVINSVPPENKQNRNPEEKQKKTQLSFPSFYTSKWLSP